MRLPTFTDSRGSLTVIEDCPFEIKRVFWIYNVPEGQSRAGHSHDLCEQILICVKGSVLVNGNDEITWLNEPNRMLYIPVNTQIELYRFSENAVLLVLASEKYDPTDQIQ